MTSAYKVHRTLYRIIVETLCVSSLSGICSRKYQSFTKNVPLAHFLRFGTFSNPPLRRSLLFFSVCSANNRSFQQLLLFPKNFISFVFWEP